MSVIAKIGHVALRVRDLDAALETAIEVMGLRQVETADGWAYLTNGAEHHTIQYAAHHCDGVDHVALEAAGADALQEIRARLAREQIEPIPHWQLDEGLHEGFAFCGPEGFVFEIYAGIARDQPSYTAQGVRPQRFGHFNFTVHDPESMADFLARVLDFRVSDYVGDGYFMRCNADHHGIAVMPGPGLMHHHAWEVQSIAELGRLGDCLDERGEHLLWGPLRHGAGRNVAAYFREPAGTIVEFYCDMQQIDDEAQFVPGTWTMEGQRWYSLWSPGLPEGFGDLGLPALEPQPPLGAPTP